MLVNQTFSVWSGFSWKSSGWAVGIYLGGPLGYSELPEDCKMANNKKEEPQTYKPNSSASIPRTVTE